MSENNENKHNFDNNCKKRQLNFRPWKTGRSHGKDLGKSLNVMEFEKLKRLRTLINSLREVRFVHIWN